MCWVPREQFPLIDREGRRDLEHKELQGDESEGQERASHIKRLCDKYGGLCNRTKVPKKGFLDTNLCK